MIYKIGDKVKVWFPINKYYPNSNKIYTIDYKEMNGTILECFMGNSYSILTDKGIVLRNESVIIK